MDNSIENRLHLIETRLEKLEAIEKRRRTFGIIKLVVFILFMIGFMIAIWFAYSRIISVIEPYKQIIDAYNNSDIDDIFGGIG